jgi:hypothetical protein
MVREMMVKRKVEVHMTATMQAGINKELGLLRHQTTMNVYKAMTYQNFIMAAE